MFCAMQTPDLRGLQHFPTFIGHEIDKLGLGRISGNAGLSGWVSGNPARKSGISGNA